MSTHDPPPALPSHPTPCHRSRRRHEHQHAKRPPPVRLAVLLTFFACLFLSSPSLVTAQQPGNAGGNGSGSPGTPAGSSPIVIKIGVVLPLNITTSDPKIVDERRKNNSETGLLAVRTALVQAMSLDAAIALDQDVETGKTINRLGIKFELIVRDSSNMTDISALTLASRKLQLPPRRTGLDSVPAQSLAATMDVISQGAVAIVGDLTSDATLYSAMLSSRLGILQCSFAAGAQGLSDKDVYPFFFRTLSPLSSQLKGLTDLMSVNKWKKVLVLVTMDAFGTGVVKELSKDEASKKKFEVIQFAPNDQAALDMALDRIAQARERVIFSGVISPDQQHVIHAAAQRNLLGNNGRQWIFINNITDSVVKANVSRDLVAGTLSLISPDPNKDEDAYVKLKTSWGRINNKTVERYENNELPALACGHMIVKAVMLYITNSSDQVGTARALADGVFPSGPLTLQMVNNTRWRGPYGIQTLDENGDLPLGYEFLNWKAGGEKMEPDSGAKKIGSSNGMASDWNKIVYMNGLQDFGESITVEDVTIKLRSNGGYVIITCCVVGTLVALGFLIAIIHNRKTPTIRAISPLFCSMVLLGLILLYIAIAFQLFIEDTLQCNITPASAVIGLALVIGNIIAKNQRIWQLFGSPLSFRHGLPDHHIMRISLGILLINTALTIWWLVASPFRRVKVSFGDEKQYYTCIPVASGTHELLTDNIPSLYEHPAFVGVCLFNGLLLVYAVILAWNTRRIPIRGYNESRAISLSIYNIFLGGAILLPTFFQPLNGLYPVVFALRTMVMLFCASFALLVFFVPPLYTLWLDRATAHDGDDSPAMDAPGIAAITLPNTPTTPHGFMDYKPPRTSFAGASNGATATESADVVGPLPSSATTPAWGHNHVDGNSLSRRRPHSGSNRASATIDVKRITQRPEKVNETYEGILVMRRSHRLTSNSSILKSIFDRFNPWQVVHVTLIPHRQVLLLTEQRVDSSGTATTTEPDTEPEMVSIAYQAVRSPHDVARERFAQRDRAMALSVLPTRGLYAVDAASAENGKTAAAATAGTGGPRSSLEAAAAAAAESVTASVRAKINLCQFVVCTAHYDYTFESETPEETVQWVSVLKQALAWNAAGETRYTSGSTNLSFSGRPTSALQPAMVQMQPQCMTPATPVTSSAV